MGEITTLTCPSCGGKPQANPNTSVLVCDYCGREHLVNRIGDELKLESFARCPRCSRNDKVDKVSAILKTQIQEANSIETRTTETIDKFGQKTTRFVQIPTQKTQATNLANLLILRHEKRPTPDYQSVDKAQNTIHWGIALISFFFFGLLALITGFESFDPICCSVWLIALLVGGIVLIKKGKDKRTSIIEENSKAEPQFENALQKWREEVNLMTKLHDELYYCHRDDCVFIPNKGTYAPPAKMVEYLNQIKNS